MVHARIEQDQGETEFRPVIRRKAVERCIESLIDLLDQMDPDPDMEPSGDTEPYLAASSGSAWHCAGSGDDLEQDPAENDSSVVVVDGAEEAQSEIKRRVFA